MKKMVSHCNLFYETDAKERSQLSCPEDILSIDVLKGLNDKLVSGFRLNEMPEPELMSEEKNSRYRELIDSGLDSQCYHDFKI